MAAACGTLSVGKPLTNKQAGICRRRCLERSLSLIANDPLQRKLLSLRVVKISMIWSHTLQNVLVLSVMVFARMVVRVESIRRRNALEPMRASYASGLALVRYVQLHRQCSEGASYQRLATFVKTHVPGDGARSMECMRAQDRQRLL